MKRQLGISIYPSHSDIKKDKEYISTAGEYGFTRIFMSMLELTGNRNEELKKYKDLISYANKLGFETILDIAPNIFNDLNISYDDLSFFNNMGASGLRLDAGFNGSKEALLTYNPFNLIIELNMSNDVAYLDNILTYQANKPYLYGCHNFYPQEGTALPYDFFESCSKRFKKYGIRTAAFVSSQNGKLGPWNINDGLPTLEMHRKLPVETAAKHLFSTGLIDDVIVGNAYASNDELEKLSLINRYQTVFTVEWTENTTSLEKDIVLNNQHYRRGDISSQVIRSTNVRVLYENRENPAHDNTNCFEIGDVVIGNDNFGKYKNELQIVLEPHEDVRKNKVGQIISEEHILIPFIKPWTKFKFTEK